MDVTKIKWGGSEWKRVKSELNRIGDMFNMLLNVSLVKHGHEHEHEEHGHKHNHSFDNSFIQDVNNFILSLSAEFSNSDVHPHVHHNHAVITVELRGVSDVEGVIRKVVDLSRECEECVVNGIDGEIRLGNDLVSIFFGDSYKVTFILPSADGKKLIIIETHI